MQSLVIYSRSAARSIVSNVINDCNTKCTSLILNNRFVNSIFTNIRFLSNLRHSLQPLSSLTNRSLRSPLHQSAHLSFSTSLYSNAIKSSLSTANSSSSAPAPSQSSLATNLHLVTASSGFSKDLTKPIVKKGVIGDDAWFVASQKSIVVLGVADGVGGWREVGVDPSKFSSSLMKTCKRFVEQNPDSFDENIVNRKTPIEILSQSYNTLLENKNNLIGSSTACIIVFHRESSYLHSANLGDSGFVIVRDSKIIHRSQEQQHYFNSPFQMAILPNLSSSAELLNDSPESASTSSFELAEGDFIVIATDGLWDNFPEAALIEEISNIKVIFFNLLIGAVIVFFLLI